MKHHELPRRGWPALKVSVCSRVNINSVRKALMTVLSDPTAWPSTGRRAVILADRLLGDVYCTCAANDDVRQSENYFVNMIHSFLTKVLDMRAYSADFIRCHTQQCC